MKTAKTGARSLSLRAGQGKRGGAHSRRGRGRRTQRGVAAVEFALVLPVLLAVLFGIVELGFMLYDKAVITNASRAAVRQAVAFGETASGAAAYMPVASATAVATNGLSSALISPRASSGVSVTVTMCTSSTSCTPNTPCSASGQSLTVAVSYPFTGLNLGSSVILGSSVNPLASVTNNLLTLNASTTMNCE